MIKGIKEVRALFRTFATLLADGGGYAVTVLTQPSDPNQTCSISHGSRTLAGSNVANIAETFAIKSEVVLASGFEG